MREFRLILARRALIVFLSYSVAAWAFFGVPETTRTLMKNLLLGSREVSAASANSAATEELLTAVAEEGSILGSSGPPPFLQAGNGDTWTETNTAKNPTTTPTKRYGHAMASTSSGDVLLFGGFGGSAFGGYLNDSWLFTPATNSWGRLTFTSSTPPARQYHAMASTPSGVLLFGGQDASSSLLNDTWLFNTITNSWTEVTGLTTIPTKRYQHAMATTPSGVLLFGGCSIGSILNDTWNFNTNINSWSQVSTSPTPPARYQHAMTATPSGVLLFGGYGSSAPLDDTWLFNTTTNTWGKITGSPSTPTVRYDYAMAATLSGNALLFGGLNSSYSSLADTWLFNVSNNSWDQLTFTTSTPSARYNHAMAATPSGNVLLFGGRNVNSRFNDTWLFTPASVPTITVSSPTDGATWVVNQPASITWTSTDVTGPCTLDLCRNGGGTWETLTTTAPAQGTYTWTVTGATSTNCLVRVTDGTVTGTSAAFAIAAHSEMVDHLSLSPASATLLAGTSTDYTLIAHDTFTNTWDITSSATYSIDPGAGGTWISTSCYTAGHAGQWMVTASNNSRSATAQLTITATLHLTSPVGGEDWIRAHAYPISWTSTGVSGTTTLELSRDNGSSWETLTTTTTTCGTFFWTVTAPRTAQALVRVSGSGQSDQSSVVFRLRDPQIDLLSPVGGEVWTIDSQHAVTWSSTDLDGTTLAIYLGRNGVDFSETLTTDVDAGGGSWGWTVSSPGTINAKVRVVQADCRDSSPIFFTITSTLFPYTGGATTLTTFDPWLEISGGSSTGTFWVTPLDPQYTSNPELNRFLEQTGQRSALFFDIGQQGLSGMLTIVLHFNPQLVEETFLLFRWNGTGWILVPGIFNPVNHTITFTVDATDLEGTPFALGRDPAALPGISPWALVLLSFSLLGLGSWWFLRRRRLA